VSEWRVPKEGFSIGLIDVDAKGKLGGTHYWATTTVHFKVTDTKEDFLKQAAIAFDHVQKSLITT
jgi:hypothetical protein